MTTAGQSRQVGDKGGQCGTYMLASARQTRAVATRIMLLLIICRAIVEQLVLAGCYRAIRARLTDEGKQQEKKNTMSSI